MESYSPCPICNKQFPLDQIESHVDKCLFLNSQNDQGSSVKRSCSSAEFSPVKKVKPNDIDLRVNSHPGCSKREKNSQSRTGKIPLAEAMRPNTLDHYCGQEHVLGKNKLFRQLIESNKVPSMILWGPPGCGKTTLAHIIHKMVSVRQDRRFVKLSATMAGVNDVKEVVQIAKNELTSLKRHTLLFMDEIHRFNKLQQDIFLPHIESGTITLIGATTENPSFYLNSALLSRCKVIVLEKLKIEDMISILSRAAHLSGVHIPEESDEKINNITPEPSFIMSHSVLKWLAEICDGDARIGLNSLQMAVESSSTELDDSCTPHQITLEHIKDGIKRSHLLYDKKGEEHYNTISALHKSIRASDDNAALYWLARMLEGGEDPLFIARRLVRAASEDVGLMDPMALSLAVAGMQACQLVGMPECDVILAQVVIYLARTHKSREVDRAYANAKHAVKNHKGALPSVPLHLRNAPTRLMKELGYGRGYNMKEKDSSNLTYMPEGMERTNFFNNLLND